jgi:hypothetical protein
MGGGGVIDTAEPLVADAAVPAVFMLVLLVGTGRLEAPIEEAYREHARSARATERRGGG